MNQKLHSIRRTFVISIVALATGSVLALGGVLYATSAIGLRQSVSPAQLNDLTRGYPEVAAYIQTQKAAEPHFTKLATLVKTDQQR